MKVMWCLLDSYLIFSAILIIALSVILHHDTQIAQLYNAAGGLQHFRFKLDKAPS